MSSILGIKSNKSTKYTIIYRICGAKIKVECPAYKYCNVCRRNNRNVDPS